MNILIVNQPLNNRGDESAHKALIRALIAELPETSIQVLFAGNNPDSIRQFSVQSERVRYINVKAFRGYSMLSKFILKTGMYLLWYIHPTTNELLKYYKRADWVVCAPGGICMGGFQDWGHISYLKMAQYVGKPIAYYGRSFGPFPVRSHDNRVFKEISLGLLRYFSFLSIRDAKSELLANSLGLNYVSTVDTAFLDSPRVAIPEEIKAIINNKRYVVFVPNLLIWHYAYKGRITRDIVIELYLRLYDVMTSFFPDDNVFMLPQTFNYLTYEGDDIHFFNDLKALIHDSKAFVISDKYSSDVQQAIISGSDCVIGARYHSIVFAINNRVPFVALNYEHKISGLLHSVGGTDTMVDITGLKSQEDINTIVSHFSSTLRKVHADLSSYDEAKKRARSGFDSFIKLLKDNDLS